MESLEQRLGYATHVGVYPKLHPYTFKLVSALATAAGQFDYSLKFTLQKIEEYKLRKERPPGPMDMLTRYTEAQREKPESFTDADVLLGAYANIVAGADTTWISLNGILYNLLKYPKTLQKLRDELDQATASEKISNPITYRQAQQMPYLQAVIKEGQRIWPATGTPLWRIVPQPGVTLCGTFFPPGVRMPFSQSESYADNQQTTVGINTWTACHNEQVFAPDPDTFRPERWIDLDEEKIAQMDRYYIPVRSFGFYGMN